MFRLGRNTVSIGFSFAHSCHAAFLCGAYKLVVIVFRQPARGKRATGDPHEQKPSRRFGVANTEQHRGSRT